MSAAVLGKLGAATRPAVSIYELLPGAVVFTADTVVFPYSSLVLIASVGGLIGLGRLGEAWWRVSGARSRGRAVPHAAALAPLPALLVALLRAERPILLIGAAWIAAAVAFWRGTPPGRRSFEKGSA